MAGGDNGTGVASIYLKVIGFAAALAGGGPAFGQAATNGFDQRHKELLAREDLQFSLAPPEEILPRAQPQPSLFSWLNDFLDAIAPLFTWIFWSAVALAAATLVWFLGREAWAARFARGKKAEDKTENQVTDFRPEPARAKALLEEADRLAALGRYDEAAHTLLYRSIADIEERAPQAIRKAQTAREIAGLPVLPEAVRGAFAPIIRAVERSWFGGRKLDADAYQTCRKAYADFALPESWAPAGHRA
jgi:hypothetical protein